MSGSVLNIIIKIVAVLLAVFLWFNVVSKKQYEYELTLPVTGVDYPVGLAPVTLPPDSLTVKVLAQGRKLMHGDWKDAGLRLKALRVHAGVNNLELTTETVNLVRSEDVTLLEIFGPATLSLQMDRVDSVLKPVASQLAVATDRGYAIIPGTRRINPIQTMVTGPLQVVRRIDSIYTASKIVDRADKSLSITLPLEIPAGMAIELSHDSAVVEIGIDKIKTRRFTDVAVTVEQKLRQQKAIIDPDKLDITISGPEQIVDELAVEDISVSVISDASIDPERDYIKPMVQLPPGIMLENMKPDSLRIMINP